MRGLAAGYRVGQTSSVRPYFANLRIGDRLTKRKESYANSESCQLEVYGLADRPSEKAKFGPILTRFVLRPDVQLKRTSTG